MNATRALVVALALSTAAAPAHTQCANGSPPPCGPQAAARKDPALDSLRWIVFPFRNVTAAPDLDWVSLASVNQLSMDMSRWTDLRVIDDEHVADLLRAVPEAKRQQLGLDSVRVVARHAGAGRLVMGEIQKNGARTILIAKVFNTGTGARVRTVIDTAQNIEAIPTTFSRLAGNVLAVPAPPGTELNGLGTRSSAAVREFTLGQHAFTRGRMDSAETHFRSALAFDSTFALAHKNLSAIYSQASRVSDQGRSFDLAMKYADALPEHDRLVMSLGQRLTRTARCTIAARLLVLDTGDVTGWTHLGNCNSPGNVKVVDSSRGVEADRDANIARRAYQHALGAYQPDRLGAFINLMILYRLSPRTLCTIDVSGPCPPESNYSAANVMIGDSLVARFERVDRFNSPARRRESAPGIRAIANAANDLAAAWTSVNSTMMLGRAWYLISQLSMGNLEGAAREQAASAELGQLEWNNINRNSWIASGVELALRQEHAERALPLLDLLVRGSVAAGASALFLTATGQFHRDVPIADSAAAVRAARVPFLAVYSGVVPRDFAQIIQAYAAVAPPSQREGIIELGTTLGFHTLRSRAAADTAAPFALFRFQAFLAHSDTVRARHELAAYDAWGDAGAENYFDAHEMFSAESYLELGDTATAWTRIEPFARRWPEYSLLTNTFWDGGGGLATSARASGRAWLLYADLATAAGHREEAKRGYNMVVGMWEKGDAPVQPLVTRAKAVLATLGGP